MCALPILQLNFCHDEPGAVEALFNTIKKVAQHSLPFQAACDCGICTDCLEEGCSNRNCHARQQSRSGDAAKDTPPELQKPVSEEIKVLWCSLCYHVQAFITQQLISNAKVLFTKHGFVQDTNWESYFEMLRFLFVVGQVQRIHQWVRSEQLRRASCPCETSASSLSSSCCIICLIQWSVQSLARDVAMRPSLEMTWHDLSDCYVDAVRSRVTACLQELWNRWHNRNATGEDKRGFSPCLANPRSCWAHSGANDSGTKSTVRTEDGVDSQNACSDWSDRRLVTAVVTLVAELYWFEQQLNGISCRTWGE
ncbi:hypothetical protein HPB48_006712 [Haemaphysalis longicornis]|uniref:Uncharacterized protein n=1 Tax=Haemaphysalis longicornis TaxID=44386 RepID=A0A9J6G4E7_HAELO|nr:hypothetical protein HPB48_006712 [Haemaphysalis longicornis]